MKTIHSKDREYVPVCRREIGTIYVRTFIKGEEDNCDRYEYTCVFSKRRLSIFSDAEIISITAVLSAEY